MSYQKINIPDEDQDFIMDYKKATGMPMQDFVVDAIKDKILRIEAENTLRDEELLKVYLHPGNSESPLKKTNS